MEHLTKQQIILLTLLVSFVTSLSTGIVTVSLMDQAPAGVTRTINQVIEKTIQEAAPTQSASVGTVSISVDDQLAQATARVASSTVEIKDINTGMTVGLGLIINKNGLILTSRDLIDLSHTYQAILSDGTYTNLVVSTLNQSNTSTVMYLVPTTNFTSGVPMIFIPITTGSVSGLGQKIFSLTGTSSQVLQDGIINQISSTTLGTTLPSDTVTPGAPVFDITGLVIGMHASSSVFLLPPIIAN